MTASRRDSTGTHDGVERSVARLPAPVRRYVEPVLDPRSLTIEPPLGGVALLLIAVLWLFYRVVAVVGGTGRFLLVIAVTVAISIGLAQVIVPRAGLWIGAILFVAGYLGYFLAVPTSQLALFTVPRMLADGVALLTGVSVFRLAEPMVWVLSIAPVPTFVSVYAGLRGRYDLAVGASGGALGFFVLTGDATIGITLLGVLGGATALGLDTLSAPGGLETRWQTLGVILVAMVLVSGTLTVVPSNATGPLYADRGTTDLDASLAADEDELVVAGSVSLSQTVQFTIHSDEPALWRTGAYDEYTGDGWARTGDMSTYDGELPPPPGPSQRITQQVTARTGLTTLPAAAKPVAVSGAPVQNAQVTEQDGIQPAVPIQSGESVIVESERLRSDVESLRAAGSAYPEEIAERYTQLPDSTPERVGNKTNQIVEDANATNPYAAAVAIETYLERNKRYSLSVEQPRGDVADTFLFEMDAGYCTFYATTMVTMLRTQGIPARFVTGYSTGEQIGDNEWAVRGQNAHAWVEIYVPDHGWVEFDPTPSAPRDRVRQARLADARQSGAAGIDVEPSASPPGIGTDDSADNDDETANDGALDDETSGETDQAGDRELDDRLEPGASAEESLAGSGQVDQRAPDGIDETATLPESEDEGLLPPRDWLGYGLLILFGAVVGAHNAGWISRTSRAISVRFQGRRTDPRADAERAFDRLEYVLERRYRARLRNESPRAYLTAMQIRGADDRIEEVFDVYERAMYAGDVSREEVESAIQTVDRFVLESTPVVRRFV